MGFVEPVVRTFVTVSEKRGIVCGEDMVAAGMGGGESEQAKLDE